MSIEKNMNARIQHKHDIEANWNKALNFIPKIGEIIVYDIDENYNYSRFKIGDGVRTINNLEFLLDTQYILHNSNVLSQLLEQYNDTLATKQPVGDYALKSEIPKDYLTTIPAEYVTETELNAKGYLTSYTETDPTVPAWAKEANKPTYTASEVGALPADTVIPTVPTNVSAFINDAGYLTQHQSLAGYATETYANIAVSSHNIDNSTHNDIRLLIEGLTKRLNALADSDDTTLDQMSEIVAYIKSNKSLIEDVTTNKVNVTDIVNNLTTNVTNKPLSAAQGVAIKGLIDALQEELGSHTHTIEDVSGLQSALDGKANSSHGTHVTYSTTAPVMDGTASAGSATTVARSDHKHPTDTSRASKTEFDTHTANTSKHITDTERTNWNAAKSHADSAHAPSNAEANQNAFSNIAVSGQTTVAADSKTDTLTLSGNNVSITTDATNDKVTFSVADGTTSAKGVVQLTDSTSSTSTTTAATPNSVKSAYDLANETKKYVDSKADIIQSASGEVIAVNNSAYTPLKGLKIFGKTEQRTTTGKNLLPNQPNKVTSSNGVTFNFNNDGSITANGTAGTDGAYATVGTAKLEVGKSYILSGCPSVYGSGVMVYTDGIYNTGLTGVTFQAEKTEYGINIKIPNGYIASNLTFYPMLRLASITDATYEPYTGGKSSPSPNYPQPLESVGDSGSVTTTVRGKNLLNYDAWNTVPINNGTAVLENNGVTLTASKDDCYTHYMPTMGYPESAKIPVQEGDTITVSWEATSNVSGLVGVFMDGGATKFKTADNANVRQLSYTVPAGYTFATIRFGVAKAGTTISYKNIQVEKGSVATVFEPSKFQTLPVRTPNGLKLPGIPVTSGGNYTDPVTKQQWICDEVDFEKGVYVQRVGRMELDGSEDWTMTSLNAPFAVGVSNISDCTDFDIRLLCDRYQAVDISDSWSKYDYLVSRAAGNSKYLQFRNTNVSTLDSWVALLGSNPISVSYVLAEEKHIPLSEEERAQFAELHTNYPNTTVYNDAGAHMGVKYYTPNTAVQMVHSPSDEGKVLTIDEHGCVVLGEPTTSDAIHNYLPLTGGTLSGNTTINNAGARYRVTNGTNTAWFGMNSAGSTIGIYDETNKKYLIQHDGTNTQLNGNCTGNAGSATKVYTTATNSSTYKSYQIPFVSGDTSGNSNLLKNNGIKFDVRDGTTSQNGVALLLLGDTTVSGTDGNKSGGLYMYNSKGKYVAMIPAENTGNITITLPSATGTLATTADINALRDEFANGSW